MADTTYRVKFTGDSAELESKLKSLGVEFDNLGTKGSSASSTIADIGKTAAGVAIGGAITQLPGFLTDAANAAAEDERATALLATAVRNAGGDFDANIAKVNDRIDAGQNLAFSDDDVRESFETLLAATGNTDEALQKQSAAMDLARGKGISLQQASTLLAKANDENVNVLRRMGITLKDGATEADLLATVQEKFGGSADAYAKSTAGQFEQAQIAMAEAQETIGGALLPIMASLATVISAVLGPALLLLTPVLDAIGAALKFMSDNADIVLPILAGIAAAILAGMIPALLAAIPVAWAHAAAWIATAAAVVVANAPFILIAAAIGLVVAAAILVVTHLDETKAVLGRILEYAQGAWGAFTGAVTGPFNAVIGFVTGVWSTVSDAVTGALQAAIDWVTGTWTTVTEGITGALQAAWDWALSTWMTVQDAVTGPLSGAIDWVTGTWSTVTSSLTGALQGFLDWLGETWATVKSAVLDPIQGAMTDAMHFVSDRIGDILGYFTSFPGNVLNALGDLGSLLWDAGVELMKGLINGIKSMATSIGQAILDAIPGGGLVGDAVGAVGGFLGLAEGAYDVPGPRGAGDIIPALLSPGEMVIPVDMADRMRGGSGRQSPARAAAMAGGRNLTVVQHFHGDVIATDQGQASRAGTWQAYSVARSLRSRGYP